MILSLFVAFFLGLAIGGVVVWLICAAEASREFERDKWRQ